MAGSTNFVQFNPNKSNMMDDNTYAGSDYRINGCRTGLAPSAIHNKLFFQTSTFVSAYSKMLANRGFIVNDSDFDTLVSVLGNTGSSSIKRQVFTVSGSITVPLGVTQMLISGCGAGAGGSSVWGLGGGGGESVFLFPVAVTPGETINISVGIGGTGGTGFSSAFNPAGYPFSTSKGTDGGNSSFGLYKTLTGGKSPIVAMSIADSGLEGGPGGTRGDMPAIFGNGSTNTYLDFDRKGGIGGSSLYGIGGIGGCYASARFTGTSRAGQNGQGYGSAGGGGGESWNQPQNSYSATTGGNGSPGIIIVEYMS